MAAVTEGAPAPAPAPEAPARSSNENQQQGAAAAARPPSEMAKRQKCDFKILK